MTSETRATPGTPTGGGDIPYGRQSITEEDIQAVVAVLRSDWLTTGPQVEAFEEALAARVGAKHAVSFSSGTAALHGAVHAAGLGPGDEAITSPLTFCATANCVLYCGATPVFADIETDTLTLDPAEVEKRITPRTRAVLPVDYAGHPADLDGLMTLADHHGLTVIEDACHALGAGYKGRPVGSVAHMTVFSFHPVKHVACGEGGMVATNDDGFAAELRLFRNHGITRDARTRNEAHTWRYDVASLGYNYRLSDIACALGLSQLSRLENNLARRSEIAGRYTRELETMNEVALPAELPGVRSAWHLYPVRVRPKGAETTRDAVFRSLRARGIGANVHYTPVYRFSWFRQHLGDLSGTCPVAEDAADTLLSLPLYPTLTDQQVTRVVRAVEGAFSPHGPRREG